MTVLLTRPAEDSTVLAARLAAHGVETLVEPMLDIEYRRVPAPDLTGVQGLLITSASGIRAFGRVCERRTIPVWAVGPGSAREAQTLGFQTVEHAGGDVAALGALVRERLNPADGELLHVAGSHLAGDLAGTLENHGYVYRRVVMYEARQRRTLSTSCIEAVRDGTIDSVALYSPRTALSLVAAIRAAGLEPCCRNITAFCLSRAVAVEARAMDWRRIEISRTPDEDSLVSGVLQFVSTE